MKMARDLDFSFLDKKVCDFCGRSFDTKAELDHHETTRHPLGASTR